MVVYQKYLIYVKNMLCLEENLNVRIHIYQTNRFRFKEKSGLLFVEFITTLGLYYLNEMKLRTTTLPKFVEITLKSN